MRFDQRKAVDLLRKQAELAGQGDFDTVWAQAIENFSEMCRDLPKTHIAFLGTAMLAKALDLDVDVFSIKAGKTNPRAYSARSLGHGALVPNAVELGISLGVTGREPLNNQPYFRFDRMRRDITVHSTAQPLINELCDILDDLQQIDQIEEARAALRSFIYVRRQYMPSYHSGVTADGNVTVEDLTRIIEKFVAENSEGGKRAQAIVAGILDVFAGPERVVTTRINDPDRHLPGDVGVRSRENSDFWERVFEVRDKPVTQSDIYLFADKALANKVEEAAIVAVSSAQSEIDFEAPKNWAIERGMSLTIFCGWVPFIREAMFWCEQPQLAAAQTAVSRVYNRLVALEVSESGASLWLDLTKGKAAHAAG